MKESPSYYAVLPAEIRYDKNLTPLERLMYAEITALSNKEGYCWAGNQYFADLYDRSPKRISEIISALAKRGYLKVEVDRGAGNTRKMWLGIPKSGATYPEKSGKGYPEKSGYNTITSNTIKNTKTKTVKVIDAKASFVASQLAQLVVANYDFAKVEPQKWAADIEKINRIDGYPYDLIMTVVRWSQEDDFWKQNIRSGKKLREKFDDLLVRMKSQKQRVAVIS